MANGTTDEVPSGNEDGNEVPHQPLPDGKKMRLTKFGAPWCAPCQALARAKTLEKLAAAHSEIEVEDIMLDYDDEGNEVENEKSKRAEAADVQALPTFIVTDAEGTELARDDGGMSMKQLEALLAKAESELVCTRPGAGRGTKAVPPKVRKGGR